MKLGVVLLAVLATAASAETAPVPTALGPAVDLTHPFDERTLHRPTEEGFVITGGSGGPLRAVAILPVGGRPAQAAPSTSR